MDCLVNFQKFLKECGRSLSEINPGSEEYALKMVDTVYAIELLKEAQLPIVGGDILSNESGKLSYAYLNWYCQKNENESMNVYANRSYEVAINYIRSSFIKNDFYVVLVVGTKC